MAILFTVKHDGQGEHKNLPFEKEIPVKHCKVSYDWALRLQRSQMSIVLRRDLSPELRRKATKRFTPTELEGVGPAWAINISPLRGEAGINPDLDPFHP